MLLAAPPRAALHVHAQPAQGGDGKSRRSVVREPGNPREPSVSYVGHASYVGHVMCESGKASPRPPLSQPPHGYNGYNGYNGDNDFNGYDGYNDYNGYSGYNQPTPTRSAGAHDCCMIVA